MHPIKRAFLIVLFSFGVVGGFAHGFASLGHCHAARRDAWEDHVADVCTRSAERVWDEGHHRGAPPPPPAPVAAAPAPTTIVITTPASVTSPAPTPTVAASAAPAVPTAGPAAPAE